MSKKYSPPAVRLRDVLVALRPLPKPLHWVVGFRPVLGQSTTAQAVIELSVTTRNGATYVWRRWGKPCSATSDTGPMSALLLAAQEAFWYLEPYTDDVLLRRVEWDSGSLLGLGGGGGSGSSAPNS